VKLDPIWDLGPGDGLFSALNCTHMTAITHAFSAKVQRRIACFLLIAGCACFVGAAWRLYVEIGFVRQASSTLGAVIAVSHDSKIPTVEFAISPDAVMRFSPASSDAFHRYSIGDRWEVLYLRDDPGSAKLNQFLHLWGGTLGFLLGSIFTLVVGWLTLTGRVLWGPLKQVGFTVD
jgi:hypothetical protein